MPREDYKHLDISKVIIEIGNNWTHEDDAIIKKFTKAKKISDANKGFGKGIKINKEHADKLKSAALIAVTGRILSSETLLKMSISHRGYKPSFESIEKSRLKRKGLKRKPESIEKGRITNTGKKHKEESKIKISIANTGKKRSPEHIASLVACHKGKKQSPETIAKRLATRAANKLLKDK